MTQILSLVCLSLLISYLQAHNILRECSVRGRKGVCLPEDDCYTEGGLQWNQCGRDLCCFHSETLIQKCLEYSNFRKSLNDSDNAWCVEDMSKRIIGGTQAAPAEYPHIVALGFGPLQTVDWMCGGTLISEDYILTAAHCLDSYKGAPKWLQAGMTNTEEGSGQLRYVVSRTYHPRYDAFRHMFDIGLIQADSPFELTSRLHPACLLTALNPQGPYFAAGWGKTKEGDEVGSPDLMNVQLNLIENDKCSYYFPLFKKFGGVLPSMMCAGQLTGGKDTCQGDSGGPLTVRLQKPLCMPGLVGVTSTGSGCGMANSPGIYSRLLYFIPWIEHRVWSPPTENILDNHT